MAERRVIADRRRIGGSDLVVTSVGIGTWSWGDKKFWTYGEDFDRKDIDRVWRRALELGASWFDTAEIYGDGASETIIGELLAKERGQPPMIATKFYPERMDPKSVRKAARGHKVPVVTRRVEQLFTHSRQLRDERTDRLRAGAARGTCVRVVVRLAVVEATEQPHGSHDDSEPHRGFTPFPSGA